MSKLQAGRRDRRAATVAMMAVLGMALAACGHNDDDGGPVSGSPGQTPVATDAFVTYVQQQTATSSDTAEPLSIDGVDTTAPETSEPVTLPTT